MSAAWTSGEEKLSLEKKQGRNREKNKLAVVPMNIRGRSAEYIRLDIGKGDPIHDPIYMCELYVWK